MPLSGTLDYKHTCSIGQRLVMLVIKGAWREFSGK